MIDSPVFPTSSTRCRACSSRPASRCAACSPRTATGITCSGGSRSRTRRSGAARRPAAAAGEPGAAQRGAARVRRASTTSPAAAAVRWRDVQSLPVPGKLSLGPAHELELHPADGHTVDGTAFAIPWLGVLVCGDYLSPVEIPRISDGGSPTAYLATLERLRLARRAGHDRRPGPRRAGRARRRAANRARGPRLPGGACRPRPRCAAAAGPPDCRRSARSTRRTSAASPDRPAASPDRTAASPAARRALISGNLAARATRPGISSGRVLISGKLWRARRFRDISALSRDDVGAEGPTHPRCREPRGRSPAGAAGARSAPAPESRGPTRAGDTQRAGRRPPRRARQTANRG